MEPSDGAHEGPRLDDDRLALVARAGARALGCSCSPDIVIVQPTPADPHRHVDVEHDADCTLLRSLASPWN